MEGNNRDRVTARFAAKKLKFHTTHGPSLVFNSNIQIMTFQEFLSRLTVRQRLQNETEIVIEVVLSEKHQPQKRGYSPSACSRTSYKDTKKQFAKATNHPKRVSDLKFSQGFPGDPEQGKAPQ